MHNEADVTVVESQAEMTPIQRAFLEHAMNEYLPDEDDVDTPSGTTTPTL